jgi:hypothetical protein
MYGYQGLLLLTKDSISGRVGVVKVNAEGYIPSEEDCQVLSDERTAVWPLTVDHPYYVGAM